MSSSTKGLNPALSAVIWVLVALLGIIGFYFFNKIGTANQKAFQAGQKAAMTKPAPAPAPATP
ncbi:MAG: hypothetical protein U1F77_19855 [Kiritimatiellia bacterium]